MFWNKFMLQWCRFAASFYAVGMISILQYVCYYLGRLVSLCTSYSDVPNIVRQENGCGATVERNSISTSSKEVKSTATRYLFLVLHGHYTSDVEADADRQLTPLGCSQAKRTGARLRNLGFNFTLMRHSTMIRTAQMASIVQEFLPDVTLQSCELLNESCPVPPEPPSEHCAPEHQQYFEDRTRIEEAFRKYFHRAPSSQVEDSCEILMCHANVIGYFVCRALQFPVDFSSQITVHHGSITQIVIKPSGRVIVGSIGDCGHIPGNELTIS